MRLAASACGLHSAFMQRGAAWRQVVVVVVVLAGCAPAPVATFEAFYQATAAKDVASVRALLCPSARQALAATDDATLQASLAVTRVVLRVSVREQSAARAVLDVVDAAGQATTVTLEAAPGTKTGWCVAGEQP